MRYETRLEYAEVEGIGALNKAVAKGSQFVAVTSMYGPKFLVSKRRRRVIR